MKWSFYKNSLWLISFLFFVSSLFIVIVSREVSQPLLKGDLSNNAVFKPDDFVIYKPGRETVYIQKKAFDNFIGKENLARVVGPDKVVSFKKKAGKMESLPFLPSRWMAVPVVGKEQYDTFVYERRPYVALVCIASGKQISLLNALADSWVLSIVHVPDGWCNGEAKIIAQSSSDELRVGFGTPLEISPLFALADGPVGVLAGMIIALTGFLLITLPFILYPGVNVMARLAAMTIYQALAGYLIFVAAWFLHSHILLTCMGCLFFVAPSAAFLFLLKRNGCRPDERSGLLFGLGIAVLLAILMIPRFLLQIGGEIWFPAVALFPASWATDNLLSIMTAKSFMLRGTIHPEFLSLWSMADRGIVQPGQMLSLMVLPGIGPAIVDNMPGFNVLQIFGSLIQGMIIPFLLFFLHDILAVRLKAVWLAVLLASTPFLMFNSFYIWPKLSGGLLFLIAALAFENALKTKRVLLLCVALLAFVLSAMNHSANFFAALVFPLYLAFTLIIRHHQFGAVRKLAYKAALPFLGTAAICLAMIYLVGIIEPKSSWPALFLLTGDGTFGLNHVQMISSIHDFLSKLTFAEFLSIKIDGFSSLFWMTNPIYHRAHAGYSILDLWRSEQMFSLFLSFGPGLLLLLIAGIASKFWQPGQNLMVKNSVLEEKSVEAIKITKIFGAASAVNLILFVLAFQMPMGVHHLPYGILLGIMMWIFAISARLKGALVVAASLQVLNLLYVWYYGSYMVWTYELPRLFPHGG
ncbi:hypothetical protein [Granulibacter bethesdensis]|uniref:hypothetical protein n=1 Tax=Granulibacter bethesdensis TaxID=364410 RepID=UPI0009341B05|nr:hypothetical protein [Granulibacter bethesdensis]